MGYTIHTANTAKDIEQIAVLAEKIWHDTYDSIIGKEQVTYMLKKYQSTEAIKNAIKFDNYLYYIATAKKQLIGFCGLKPEKNQLFLSKLYVDPTYQRQGIAKQFFDTACILAKEKKLEILYLTVNKNNHHAISVYQHLGFQKVDDVTTDIGSGYVMDDYIMQYTL